MPVWVVADGSVVPVLLIPVGHVVGGHVVIGHVVMGHPEGSVADVPPVVGVVVDPVEITEAVVAPVTVDVGQVMGHMVVGQVGHVVMGHVVRG